MASLSLIPGRTAAPAAPARVALHVWISAVAAAVLLLVVAPVALASSPYWLNVLTNACILGVASLGVWVTFAIGRINIAQGAFMMIGGYTTAILATRYGVPFLFCLPVSAVVAAVVGTLVGAPILRLRGVYFAMITLSLGEAVRLAFLNGGSFTMGATGIVNIPAPAWASSPLAYYLPAAWLLLLALLAVWRLASSRIGQVFRSMRLNEELAASIGIDVARYRIIAFAIASAMGGTAGAYFAIFQRNIYPASYTMQDSVNVMLYCFFGGLDYVLGPVIGGFLLVVAFELLNALQKYQALLYGALMIALMLFLPNGILSLRLPALRRSRGEGR
jgi:branched-chain amino acid transport system permease protein